MFNIQRLVSASYQLKGQVTFLKLCLLVGSVPGTDNSWIYAFWINRFQDEKSIYKPVPA